MFLRMLLLILFIWALARAVRALRMTLWDGEVRDTRRSKIRRTSTVDLDASQIEEAQFEEIEE